MKRIIFFLTVVAIGFTACTNKGKEKEPVTPALVNDPVKDSASIRAVVLDFYTWYTANYQKLMGYDLYTSLKNKNAAPYKINWDEVQRYQAYIRDSIPQLGDAFLAEQKSMFEKADSAFKVDTADDVPYYFDFDWYTNSQEEPSYLLDGISKSKKWIIRVKGDDASVEIGAPEDKDYTSGSLLLYIGMKKENGSWTIAKIGID